MVCEQLLQDSSGIAMSIQAEVVKQALLEVVGVGFGAESVEGRSSRRCLMDL